MKMGPMKTPKLLFEGTAFEEKSLKKKKVNTLVAFQTLQKWIEIIFFSLL